MTRLSNLLFLKLHNNHLRSIDATTFQDLTKLIELDIRSNKMVSFDRNALVGLNELEKV